MTAIRQALILITFLFANSIMNVSEAQFAYPADPNPPQFDSTFSCYVCDGNGCGDDRVMGTHNEATCTGPRVACWTITNTETLEYTRTCEQQPPTIRQGVFCNRHMEGKEFCYGANTPQGRVRLCGKCCLTNQCNSGPLQKIPDSSLQTCVACQGSTDDICNSELPLSIENSTYSEQCLLPNSDCWTERLTDIHGKDTFVRGCQLETCNSENMYEICSVSNGQVSCSQCCQGKLCNRFGNAGNSLTPSCGRISLLIILLGFCLNLRW